MCCNFFFFFFLQFSSKPISHVETWSYKSKTDDLFLLIRMSLTLYKWIIRFYYIANLPSDSERESSFQKQLVRCLLYKERYVIRVVKWYI